MKQPKRDIMKTDISGYQITEGSLKCFLPILACNKYVLVTNIGYNVGISEWRAQISILFTLGIPKMRLTQMWYNYIYSCFFYFFLFLKDDMFKQMWKHSRLFALVSLCTHRIFSVSANIQNTSTAAFAVPHKNVAFSLTFYSNGTQKSVHMHLFMYTHPHFCLKHWISVLRCKKIMDIILPPADRHKKESYTPWWVVVVSISPFCPCLPGLKCYPSSHTNRPNTQQCQWNQYYLCIASQFEGQCLQTVEATMTSEPYSSILPSTLNLCSISQIICRAAKGTKQYPWLA